MSLELELVELVPSLAGAFSAQRESEPDSKTRCGPCGEPPVPKSRYCKSYKEAYENIRKDSTKPPSGVKKKRNNKKKPPPHEAEDEEEDEDEERRQFKLGIGILIRTRRWPNRCWSIIASSARRRLSRGKASVGSSGSPGT